MSCSEEQIGAITTRRVMGKRSLSVKFIYRRSPQHLLPGPLSVTSVADTGPGHKGRELVFTSSRFMPAFHKVSGPSDAAFIFCDHASNAVPDWIGDLGVSDEDMARHIAWDIGSETVGRTLARELDCGALICGFSRLVIDTNRDPNAAGLIPEVSDGTIIPANQGLSPEARAERRDRLYQAYHDALGEALDQRPKTFAISVHSFTPQLKGEPKRPTDVGLLTKADEASADAFVARMAEVAPHFQVDINLPYSAYELNFTVDHSVVCRGLRHLAIELRQDHISTRHDAEAMGQLLARAIRPLL